MKQVRRYPVIVDINGQIFHGTRIVEGTSILTQTIRFVTYSRFDGHRYKPNEEAVMESVARLILRELIRESEKLNS